MCQNDILFLIFLEWEFIVVLIYEMPVMYMLMLFTLDLKCNNSELCE